MGTYSVFGQGARGGSPFGLSAGGPYSMGMEVGINYDCYATHIWFNRYSTGNNPTVGRLYSVATATTGTPVPGTDVTFSYGAETGWINAPLAAPVLLSGGSLFRIVILVPSGYTYTNQYFSTGLGSSGISNGPITAYSTAGSSANVQGQTRSGQGMVLTYPTSGSSSNYWVDMTVTDTINERPIPRMNIQQAVDRSNNY